MADAWTVFCMFKIIIKKTLTLFFAVVIYNSSLLRMVSLLKKMFVDLKVVFLAWVWGHLAQHG